MTVHLLRAAIAGLSPKARRRSPQLESHGESLRRGIAMCHGFQTDAKCRTSRASCQLPACAQLVSTRAKDAARVVAARQLAPRDSNVAWPWCGLAKSRRESGRERQSSSTPTMQSILVKKTDALRHFARRRRGGRHVGKPRPTPSRPSHPLRPLDGPGTDGLPYSTWRCARRAVARTMSRLLRAFAGGVPTPRVFNESWLAVLPRWMRASDVCELATTCGH